MTNPRMHDKPQKAPVDHVSSDHVSSDHVSSDPDQPPARLCSPLLDYFQPNMNYVVALSGGVDSAVVAKAAFLAVGDRAEAMTANSPSVADRELDQAKSVAQEIGIKHTIVATDEIKDVRYVRNASDRCYFCKSELYSRLKALAEEAGEAVILNGTNADDLGDHRPGLLAANEFRVASPLAELGIEKSKVRAIARMFGLSLHDKPASPCLASRIAYGEQVTLQRLQRTEQAEDFLHQHGFAVCRVRTLAGDVARVELPQTEIARCRRELESRLIERLLELGYQDAFLDPAGFRSGRMNDALSDQAVLYELG